MNGRLHLIASCTDRKKLAVTPELQLRAVREQDLSVRAARWCERLAQEGDTAAGRDLYAGEHWVGALELEREAKSLGLDTDLWVCSAGYGLVSVANQLRGYAATFASGSRDSVWRGPGERAATLRSWWAALAERRGLPGARGFVQNLMRKSPEAMLVVVASPAYLDAMADDLLAARALVADVDQLVIVSSRCPPALEPNLVPSTDRLLSIVGGTRIGLHVHVAVELLKSGKPSVRRWNREVAQMRKRARPAKRFERAIMTDDEVRDFVTRRTLGTWSAGLKVLRSTGHACEQKRFKKLFQEVGSS